MAQNRRLIVTTLIDNEGACGLEGEWGLSLHACAPEASVLLDFGQTAAFARNANRLGIDLGCVDHAVLSHAHYDHSDGMEAFFEENDHAPLHMSAACAEDCWSTKGGTLEAHYIGIRAGLLERHAARIVRHSTDRVSTIAPGMHLLPHSAGLAGAGGSEGMFREVGGRLVPDTFAHELTLACECGPDGLALLSSCSHAGVARILEEAERAFPGRRIEAFVGGLHLKHADDEAIGRVADALAKHDVSRLWCGHCTGERASELLAELLPGRVSSLHPGLVIEL